MQAKTGEAGAVYRHVDVITAQESKRGADVCGDCVIQEKTGEAATIAVFDGIGSGIKANIAAHLNASRMMNMIKGGFSLRETVEKIAASMHAAREENIPFAAFAVARVLNDGHATVLTYEMPAPVFIRQGRAHSAQQRFFIMGGEVVAESHFRLDDGCAILMFSDGVTQAGMGSSGIYPAGWGQKEVESSLNSMLKEGVKYEEIPRMLTASAKKISGGVCGDDTTVVMAVSRPGRTVNIMTGPPSDKSMDFRMAHDFVEAQGIKMVCGSTTADILSRETGIPVKGGRQAGGYINPPRYYMRGIDIVTEGAFSLNQLCNILDYEKEKYDRDSCVSEMAILIKAVDRVVIWLGRAENPGYQPIVFPQLGLFPRARVIPLIEEKLRKMGKLVMRREY